MARECVVARTRLGKFYEEQDCYLMGTFPNDAAALRRISDRPWTSGRAAQPMAGGGHGRLPAG